MATALPPYVKLNEFVTLRCALGTRFRDSATGQIVASGLRVTARPASPLDRAERIVGQRTPSGNWVFHGLPRLKKFERGASDRLPAAPQRFKIEVEDDDGRFLPMTFVVEATVKGPTRFEALFSPPLDWGGDIPLFSSPARAVPAGCGVIRANLIARQRGEKDKPAAWSLLRATATVRRRTILQLGVANSNGDVAVMLPWPELASLPLASPPTGTRVDGVGWEFKFSGWHDFQQSQEQFADLDAILARLDRAPDKLFVDSSPIQDFQRASLRYGQELIVPETDPETDLSSSRNLIITPAV